MKTIKQIADELGVSKDKVRYQVGKLPSNYIVKVGKITHLTNDGYKRVLECFGMELPSNLHSKSEENYTPFTYLEEQIEFLKKQLEKSNEEKNELIKLLDQEQQLHLLSNQKVNVLELELKETKKRKWKLF